MPPPAILSVLLLFVCYVDGSLGQGQASVDSSGSSFVLRTKKSDFLGAYAAVFKMSDGSSIDPSLFEGGGEYGARTGHTGFSIEYVSTLLEPVGVEVLEDPDDAGMVQLKVSVSSIPESLLLAVIGNFVLSPPAPGPSSAYSLPAVVVDVYTGRLQLVSSFSMLRAYFLETLLIISVIAIARLSLVRKVTVHVQGAAK